MASTLPIEPNGLLWSYSTDRVVNNQLGQNEFLKLLVAQLQYQDPLEPMKDSDFVAQLAQFSSLEQLTSMSKSMSYSQAYALVGKVVVAEAYIDGEFKTIPGVVDGIVIKDNEIYAQIGDYIVKTSTITQVYDNELFKVDQTLMNSSNLIGRVVTAAVTETKEEDVTKEVDGESVTEKVTKQVTVNYTGIVTAVGIEKSDLVATIQYKNEAGELVVKKVPVSSIIDIRIADTQNGDTFDYDKLAALIASLTKPAETQTPDSGGGETVDGGENVEGGEGQTED